MNVAHGENKKTWLGKLIDDTVFAIRRITDLRQRRAEAEEFVKRETKRCRRFSIRNTERSKQKERRRIQTRMAKRSRRINWGLL
jgi:hypothetical protein